MAELFKCAFEKLNHSNYEIWSQKIEMLLIRDDLWDVIKLDPPVTTGDKPASAADVAAWSRKDDKARATIGLYICDNRLKLIKGAASAKDAWEKLKNHHQKGSLSSVIHLYKKAFALRYSEASDMEKFIDDLAALFDKLAALGEDLKDKMKAAIILSSLPESYSGLINSLECRSDAESLTVEFVREKLIDEYDRRKERRAADDLGEELALKTVQTRKPVPSECFFCKKKGHYKRDCDEYKKWKKGKKKGEEKFKEKTTEKANKASDSLETVGPESLFVANEKLGKTCFVSGEKCEYLWLVDSGATSHMCISKGLFSSLDCSLKGYIELAEGEKRSEVHGKGSVIIKSLVNGIEKGIKLHNVLYVPSFSSNLLSVKKLVMDDFDIYFGKSTCRIMKNEEILACARIGPDSHDLYGIQVVAEKACAVMDPKSNAHGPNCEHVWHKRFGHRNLTAVRDLAAKDLASGIVIKKCGVCNEICESCVKGKLFRAPFPKEAERKSNAPLDLIHTDVCGPMQALTPGGKRYVITLIDDYSRYTYVYFMHKKNEASSIIKRFVKMAKTQFNKTLKCIRSDRGREYVNKNLRRFLQDNGIKIEYTATYTPEQNGVAERKNRSLLEMARCMLCDSDMDQKYWAEAVHTANFLQNRLPTRSVSNKTPFEAWTGRKPDVRHLHIFGTEAYIHIPKVKRRKLDEKGEKLIFIGYSEESKAFRFIDMQTGRLEISRDAVFTEKFPSRSSDSDDNEFDFFLPSIFDIGENAAFDLSGTVLCENSQERDNANSGGDNCPSEDNIGTDSEYESAVTDDESENSQDIANFRENCENSQNCENLQNCENSQNNALEPRRSARSNKGVPPDRYDGEQVHVAKGPDHKKDPKSIKEALSGPEKDHWKKAVNEELGCLLQNETWVEVPKPKDKTVITCKWVFKRKFNANGEVIRYKARLVARGFSQKYGTDYDEVFAPVVRQSSLKALLTIAGHKNLIVKHFDAKTAFLNGVLSNEVYMQLPEGYKAIQNEEIVCRLRKGLYGLKQAAKLWYDKLNRILKELGFVKSKADSCLYIKKTKRGVIYLVVHVDDFCMAASDIHLINETAECLQNKFNLVDLGCLQRYLGIEVRKNTDGFFCLKQEQYIDTILERFGLKDAKPSQIPLDTGYLKARNSSPPMEKSERYQQLIGALLYVAVNTRPDIAASVTILSQYNKQPLSADWNEAKRVCRYLLGSKDHELVLGQKDETDMQKLIGYADADWAENRSDRKSNSGYLFKFMGAPISWSCRKQSCVAISTTEAEYIALSEACQEAVWLIRLLSDFSPGSRILTAIYEDNQSCLKLLDSNKFSNRTKHIDTKYHFAKALKIEGKMNFVYCPTEHMIADMLTKPLGKIRLRTLAQKCGVSTR